LVGQNLNEHPLEANHDSCCLDESVTRLRATVAAQNMDECVMEFRINRFKDGTLISVDL
jgi:hypothetical protein